MKYAYYPGCSLESTGIEYDMSTRIVAKHLGIDLWEIPDWICCGASAAHGEDPLLAVALPAYNLSIAEKEGLDVAVPCAACYNRMRGAEVAVQGSKKTQERVSQAIEVDYQGKTTTFSLLDILANKVDPELIKSQVIRPLTGLKVASYYGCLLVRPIGITGFDDAENPMSMDRLIEALGAEPVPWSFKTECCGAGHTTSLSKDANLLLQDIYDDAKRNEADCFSTACPLCFLNLDMRQKGVEKVFAKEYDLPVFYITELMGLAFGYSPKELGLPKHFVDGLPLLEGKDLLRHPATRREEA
ncbi:MAG: CoB--CoM heterodisulfide reductase iron-sulfur subunit B family protein [Bacillota bacterium]